MNNLKEKLDSLFPILFGMITGLYIAWAASYTLIYIILMICFAYFAVSFASQEMTYLTDLVVKKVPFLSSSRTLIFCGMILIFPVILAILVWLAIQKNLPRS